MKTKTMAMSMMLTFFSCALFAQNQTDTVPQTTPGTDSIPRTDTASTDTARATTFVIQHQNLKSIAQNNSGLTDQIVYATFPAKEDEITISGK